MASTSQDTRDTNVISNTLGSNNMHTGTNPWAANRGADDSSTDAVDADERVPATRRLQRDPILHRRVLAMQPVLAL